MVDGSSSLHPTDQTFSSESYINYEKKNWSDEEEEH
jgi:hypothetical protein